MPDEAQIHKAKDPRKRRGAGGAPHLRVDRYVKAGFEKPD